MRKFTRPLQTALEDGIIDLAPMVTITVTHARWCGLYSGRKGCTCDPAITIFNPVEDAPLRYDNRSRTFIKVPLPKEVASGV